GRANPRRFRWGLSYRAEVGHPSYERARNVRAGHWRPAEREWFRSDPSGFGRRLMEPITIAAHLRYWGGLLADAPDATLAPRIVDLLDEALPVIDRDVASWFLADDPWRDSFGLWLLTREAHAVGRLRDVLFSLAIRGGGLISR